MKTTLLITAACIAITLWVWALLDIARSRFKSPFLNTITLISIVLFPFLGPVLYFIFRKKLLQQEKRKFQPKFNSTP